MDIFCPKNFYRTVNLTVLFRHSRGHLYSNNHKSEKNPGKTYTTTTSKKRNLFSCNKIALHSLEY